MRYVAVLIVLLVPLVARATARHEASLSAGKKAAVMKVRFLPSGGYDVVTFGVTPGSVGRYGKIRLKLETRLRLKGPVEKTYKIPYDKAFKRGDQITLISQWPAMGRTHHWGDQAKRLP